MDWDDLRFVLAIGRAGTLSAAGDRLGVTHSTVGRRLGRLEAQLGVRLFDRTPEGFVPTTAGVELIATAEELERHILRAEGRVKGQDTQLEGALRVSTLDWLFEVFVDAFASFRERYPRIELTVTCTETEVSLFRREADVALRMTNHPPETLVGRRIGAIEFAVYGHQRFAGRPWSEVPWLHWDERLDAYVRWMDGWLAKDAPGAPLALRIGENTLVRRASLLAGLGVHPLPCWDGDRHPELVRLGPVLDAFTRQCWMLTLPALRNTRRVRAFLEHMGEATREHPALAGEGREVGKG